MNKSNKKIQKGAFKFLGFLMLMCLLTFICAVPVYATENSPSGIYEELSPDNTETPEDMSIDTEDISDPELLLNGTDGFELNITSNAGSTSMSSTLQMMVMLTILSIAPSILLMITSFTRIVVVLHFVRAALGLQTTPPNQVIIGLSLFLTFFIMSPVFSEVNTEAIKPLSANEITQEEAIERGLEPIREFMFKQTDIKDLKLFLEIADIPSADLKDTDDIPTTVLIPAFMISELRKGFIMGFLIYLPFIVMDMVVSSTLMSMGMMMLPPTVISLPFKLLLFVLADGWNLIIGELVKTFY